MPLLVERIAVGINRSELADKERDALRMTFEERRWVRRRVTTMAGREIALALPTGTVLQPETILAVEPNWYLEIEAAEEPVLAVKPRDRTQAIQIAFEVGNLHFPLALDGETLLVPDDSAMVRLLSRLGIPCERVSAPFHPIGLGHRHAP